MSHLHIGQVLCSSSHGSMQDLWKKWLQTQTHRIATLRPERLEKFRFIVKQWLRENGMEWKTDIHTCMWELIVHLLVYTNQYTLHRHQHQGQSPVKQTHMHKSSKHCSNWRFFKFFVYAATQILWKKNTNRNRSSFVCIYMCAHTKCCDVPDPLVSVCGPAAGQSPSLLQLSAFSKKRTDKQSSGCVHVLVFLVWSHWFFKKCMNIVEL